MSAEVVWHGVLLPRAEYNDSFEAAADALADGACDGSRKRVFALLDHRAGGWSLGANDWRRGGGSWFSPLHQAAWGGASIDVVEGLVARAAWRALRDADGHRPVDIARERGADHLLDALGPRVAGSPSGAARPATPASTASAASACTARTLQNEASASPANTAANCCGRCERLPGVACPTDSGRRRLRGRLPRSLGLLNALDLVVRSSGVPIRVASKSIRVREVLDATLALPGYQGILAFTLPEALWLAETHDDIVLGYPSVDRAALAALAADAEKAARITLMVDDLSQLDLIDAGAGDAVIRWMQGRSGDELRERRGGIVAAVRAVADLEFVNGGGTGSLEFTASDPAVTETTAGSGLLAGHLFDLYRHFDPAPAAAFALEIVRRPAPDIVTVLGGGWIASGPPVASRQPLPVWPPGLRTLGREGAGEVQTPLQGVATRHLSIGDRVWFRHAKSGELAERIDRYRLTRRDELVGESPTYRGEGKTFL